MNSGRCFGFGDSVTSNQCLSDASEVEDIEIISCSSSLIVAQIINAILSENVSFSKNVSGISVVSGETFVSHC